MSSLASLLATATGVPGFELWRGLAPRRFLVEDLLADAIKATEVITADQATGLVAVITTSPLGLPETLPDGWREIERCGEYLATFRVPIGSTARTIAEELALELIPLFYPSEVYEDKLITWLEKELGGDAAAMIVTNPVPDPGPLDTFRVLDIPSPRDYQNPRSETEQDLDHLYGDGRMPPQYHGYNRDCVGQLAPTYGPPEAYDSDIQAMEEQAFYFG
ncbi:MAG: hypothetical protein AAFN92_16140 [Bacteroidota bacterium]